MISYPIEIGETALRQLQSLLQSSTYSQLLVLVDEHTHALCYPILAPLLPPHTVFSIPSGEQHKQLDTCTRIWERMTELSMDRNGLVLNLGGGVIGDMGGFVARTYKRGIDFVQIPTTLLSQVDASVGSKLGIDFKGFKNHIGLFHDPVGVYIYPPFLNTLSDRELASGFAEVVKHHLIADGEAWKHLQSTTNIRSLDLPALIKHSIQIKSRIVESDPFEKGARKSLNFGHTIGHAIESHLLESSNPLLHGEAIAIGMICESKISQESGLLSEQELSAITQLFLRLYPRIQAEQAPTDAIYARTINDKKNESGQVLCTLLNGIGQFVVNQAISQSQIAHAMEYYFEH